MTTHPSWDSASNVDETLLEMGLRMTPEERLRWLEDTVEELLPWVGLAAPGRPLSSADDEKEEEDVEQSETRARS